VPSPKITFNSDFLDRYKELTRQGDYTRSPAPIMADQPIHQPGGSTDCER
jgi:hypothetical protein